MAVQLTVGKKKVPSAPKTVSGSLYGYANKYVPKPVKPKLPAGMAPINAGMSDADREAYLSGGGAWGTGGYSPPQPKPDVNTGGIKTAAKYRPDFKQYIAEAIPGDWEVQDAEAAFGTRMAGLRSALTGDIRSSLIGLGLPGDTGINQEFGSYIDQDTIQKAIGNKYSTAAQIAEQETLGRKRSNAALAARGMLESGWTTNNAAQIAAEGEKGRYQAVQDFLKGARGGLAGLGEAEAGLQGNIATARSKAAARLAQQYGYDFPEEQEAAEDLSDDSGGSTSGGTKPSGATVVAKKKKVAPAPKYNPKGYVPGGSTKAVAKAIVSKAKKR